MSNRKLRTITISATLAHRSRGVRARAAKSGSSTPRVYAYRARAREGIIELRLTVSERILIQALEAEDDLEGLDSMNDAFVREATQIFFEDPLTRALACRRYISYRVLFFISRPSLWPSRHADFIKRTWPDDRAKEKYGDSHKVWVNIRPRPRADGLGSTRFAIWRDWCVGNAEKFDEKKLRGQLASFHRSRGRSRREAGLGTIYHYGKAFEQGEEELAEEPAASATYPIDLGGTRQPAPAPARAAA